MLNFIIDHLQIVKLNNTSTDKNKFLRLKEKQIRKTQPIIIFRRKSFYIIFDIITDIAENIILCKGLIFGQFLKSIKEIRFNGSKLVRSQRTIKGRILLIVLI